MNTNITAAVLASWLWAQPAALWAQTADLAPSGHREKRHADAAEVLGRSSGAEHRLRADHNADVTELVVPGEQPGGSMRANSLLQQIRGADAARMGGDGALLIPFSDMSIKEQEDLTKNLAIMDYLIEKALRKSLGNEAPEYRMGIPLLARNFARPVDSLYLEGFGVVFMANVRFPLVAPASAPAEKPEPSQKENEWERAKNELFGGRSVHPPVGFWGAPAPKIEYSAERVAKLKSALVEVLKNAAHIHSLKPEENVAITVFGSPNASPVRAIELDRYQIHEFFPEMTAESASVTTVNRGSGGAVVATVNRRSGVAEPGTVLTIRARKSDIDAFANGQLSLEKFSEKASIHTIEARSGGTSYHLGTGYGTGYRAE